MKAEDLASEHGKSFIIDFNNKRHDEQFSHLNGLFKRLIEFQLLLFTTANGHEMLVPCRKCMKNMAMVCRDIAGELEEIAKYE